MKAYMLQWGASSLPWRRMRVSLCACMITSGCIEGEGSEASHQTGNCPPPCTFFNFGVTLLFLSWWSSFSECGLAITLSNGPNPLVSLFADFCCGRLSHSLMPLLTTTSFPPKLRSLTSESLGQLKLSSHPHWKRFASTRRNWAKMTEKIVHKRARPANSIVEHRTAITIRLSFWTATLLPSSFQACAPSCTKDLLACTDKHIKLLWNNSSGPTFDLHLTVCSRVCWPTFRLCLLWPWLCSSMGLRSSSFGGIRKQFPKWFTKWWTAWHQGSSLCG